MARLAYCMAAITALVIASGNVLAAESITDGGVEITIEKADLSNLTFHPHLDCQAYGTPIDFPDDIILTNKGPGIVRAGTQIHWQMEGGNQGTHVLPDLAPKQSTYIFNANPGGVPTGRKCKAEILGNPDLTIVR